MSYLRKRRVHHYQSTVIPIQSIALSIFKLNRPDGPGNIYAYRSSLIHHRSRAVPGENQGSYMNHRKRLFHIIVLLFITFGFATGVVAADYIGPDRVHTETSYDTCEYGGWAKSGGGCWAGTTPVDCTLCGWECDPGSCPGADYYFVSGLRVVSHTVTVTDPEATASSSVNCSVWGDASWCTQPANTVITAHEPMPANQIILVEGTRNGETFACSGTSCTVPMLEGSNALTYWAISDYGDSSRMGNRMVLQDTQTPQINASLSGTAGQNGWFVSPADLTVVYSDPLPGSGLAATSALINGTLTDVSQPVTLTEGVYAVALDVRDVAGLTAQVSQMVYVDTTAPALTPLQPQAEVNGYMNGSVIFRGTVNDVTSGVSTVLVTVDGVNWDGATLNPDDSWVLDWNSAGMADKVYTPRVAAVDNAGNRTEISLQAINLDNSPPGMSMTNAWYIWESGHLRVEDNRSGIQRIQLSVRDDQNRWPAMIWEYEVPVLERDLQWNRRFADGTIAPIGSYEVLLQAWDKLGNESWLTARIHIPAAGATPPIPPQTILITGGETPTAVPTLQETLPAVIGLISPTSVPTVNPTPVKLSFSSVPDKPASVIESSESKAPSAVDPNLLWGAAAISAAAGAAAYALQKKKEREAARKAAEEAERDAAYAKVAAYEERKKQNYLQKVYAERRRTAEALYAKCMGKVEDVELGPEEAPVIRGLEQAKDVEVYGPSKAEQQRIDKLSRVEEQTAEKDVIERSVGSKTEKKPTASERGFFGSALAWLNAQIVQPVNSTLKTGIASIKNNILNQRESKKPKPVFQEQDNNERQKTIYTPINAALSFTSSMISGITFKNDEGNITKPWWQPAIDLVVKIGISIIDPVYKWVNEKRGNSFYYDSIADFHHNNNYLNYERWDAIWGNGPNKLGLELVETQEALIKETAARSEYVSEIALAASLSIQGDSSKSFLEFIQEIRKKPSDAFGIGGFTSAQIADMKEQLLSNGIEPNCYDRHNDHEPYYDQRRPEVAAQAMIIRLEEQLKKAGEPTENKLTETDKMIVCLMTHNNAFDLNDVIYNPGDIKHYEIESNNEATNIDWEQYFQDMAISKRDGSTFKGGPTGIFANFRAGALEYNKQFMLKLAVNDIEKMLESGQWMLPEEVDFELIKELATTPPDFNEGK